MADKFEGRTSGELARELAAGIAPADFEFQQPPEGYQWCGLCGGLGGWRYEFSLWIVCHKCGGAGVVEREE